MTRVFDAPRGLVFEAWTRPELLKRWLLGRPAGPCRSARLARGGRVPLRLAARPRRNGRTTCTHTTLYESREARDTALETGGQEGMAASYDRLAEVLASMA